MSALVHHRLTALRWTREDAKRAAEKHALVIFPPRVEETTRSYHFRTGYADGEEQRRRAASLAANEAFIAGMLLRGIPAAQVAAGFMISDMAIYNRCKALGIAAPSVRVRREKVDRHPPKQKLLVIEVYDNDADPQAAAAQG